MNTMWKLFLCCWWLAGTWATPPLKDALKCNKCESPSCESTVVVQCPVERPFCATSAVSPDFQSVLTCAADMQICEFWYKDEKYKLLCACERQQCNTVFSKWMRDWLMDFDIMLTINTNVTTNLTEMLVGFAFWANTSTTKLYELVVGRVGPGEPEDGPHFEALTGDDADYEAEGSGAGASGCAPQCPSGVLEAGIVASVVFAVATFVVIRNTIM